MRKLWVKDNAIDYWVRNSREYHRRIEERLLRYLHFVEYVTSVNTAVSIGGGAYGGLLRYAPAVRHVLCDALVNEFRELGTIPDFVEAFDTCFTELPLTDGVAGIVIACEVFDHADDLVMYRRGQQEAVRILKSGGLLFAAPMIRDVDTDGHIAVTVEEDLKVFEDMERIHFDRTTNQSYAVYRK